MTTERQVTFAGSTQIFTYQVVVEYGRDHPFAKMPRLTSDDASSTKVSRWHDHRTCTVGLEKCEPCRAWITQGSETSQ